jgi:ATP-dependent helicase/nuclease subunit B
MPGTLRTVPAAQATAALRELVAELRGDDPLAALTVVVPSALAGATLRRGLLPGGVAGIRFTSLPQYVDGVLTAAGLSSARRTGARRRALVASALDGTPWAASSTTETLRLFDALLAELDEAELPAGEDLGAPDVLAVHRHYRALLAEQERVAPADRAAAVLPAKGEPVVLHLPRRLTKAELRFCQALDGRLHAVTSTDSDPALVTLLDGLLTRAAPPEADPPPRQIEVSVDIDAEEEVRSAVRRVLEHLAAPAHRADRIAIAYRSAVPYARLVHEQLTAAGLPHHVPRQRSLAQSIAGGALLGLLALPDNGFSRPELSLWWSSAPLLDLGGRRISATRWDRLSRDAGVTRGRQLWLRRLDEALQRAADDLQREDDDRRRDRVAQLETLRAEMVALFEEHDALASTTSWAACADLCRDALDRHLGGVGEVASWQPRAADGRETSLPAERSAYDGRQILNSLRDLDGSQPFPGLLGFRQVLEGELARPLRESNGMARGVIVSPLSDLAGADLDLLLVLGMVEGSFPPRAREHPVLRDAARQQSGGALRTTEDRTASEKRDFLHGIATAPRVVLSWPAADARSRRGTHPAPWLLEHCQELPEPLSFTQRTTHTGTPLHAAEYDQQLLLRAGGEVGPEHPLAAHVPELATGLSAVAERSARTFGPWTGNVGPLAEVAATSASGLQKYANCPHSFFLDKVLRVRDREEPDEEASPLHIGLVVHAALEEFFGQHLGRAPDAAWTGQEHAQAHALLDRHTAALADEGKAGRPLVWETRTRQMHRSLRRTLLADDVWRREHRATPRGVEVGFGVDGAELPAIEVRLDSGRTVSVRGSIDRVDEHENGSLTVLDWKTGSADKYDDLKKEPLDLVGGGSHLQLPLYAEAARQWHGQDVPVQAFYVLVDHGAARRGGEVDEQQDDRLHDALETLTAGVAAGVFPVNPGEEGYFGWTHCGFCAFERLCPSSRGTQWEGVRQDPALSDYLQLTSPPEPEEAP